MKLEIPQISIILPFFNAQKTLERAILSVANQTFEDFECILINNNSTDGSVAIAKEWCEKDKRFLLINEEQQGVVFASNAGAQISKAKYTARMDADDWAHPQRLGQQYDFLENNPDYDAAASRVKYISHNKEETGGFKRYVEWNNSIVSYQDLLKKQFVEMPLVNPTCMWRKSSADKFGLYRAGDFPEDYEMWLRWLSLGAKICKLPERLLHWHDSNERLTRTHSAYTDSAFYKIKSQYLVKWLTKHNPNHPEVVVWGASRISRRRARLIEKQGIKIKAYIDTKKGRQIDKEIIYYENLQPAGQFFILVYIKQADAREEICEYLNKKGYVEGSDFLLIS